MEKIVRLLLVSLILCACHNGRITVYQYHNYLDVDVKTESTYCIPNAIVMVGQKQDSSTWYWYGEALAEGYEIVRVVSIISDSLNIYAERTYFNGNPETFVVKTEILMDTMMFASIDVYNSLYEDLQNFDGNKIMEKEYPRYGESFDSRSIYIMKGGMCKQISIQRKANRSERNFYTKQYDDAEELFLRVERLISGGV